MRTTLTLDDDVAARLERLRAQRDESLKVIVNDLLRRGLDAADRPGKEPAPYRIEPHDSGRCYLPGLDSLHDALVFGEGEAYR
ncbi:MAG TPA: ribbon-helix-helix protein, CopG family [Longimicrobiales bacterium]|nr:ribbon-helix-helix protein, CopG family [Longimicrobiales bacterium]